MSDKILNTSVDIKEYSLDWVIKNYGPVYRKVSNFVDSPPIYFDIDPEIEWLLRLDVCSFVEYDIVKVFLKKGSTGSKNISVVLLLLNTNQDVLQSEEIKLADEFSGTADAYVASIKIKNSPKDVSVLADDTLIVRFKVTYHSLVYTSFCLNRVEFSELGVLEKLFEEKKFTDAQIMVGDRVFNVHKCVLDARSEYFSAMFGSEMKERRENEVKIKDVSHEVMQEVLRYIYTGRARNLDVLKADLFVAADEYNLEGLKVLCEDALIRDLRVENVLELLVFADQYNSGSIKEAAMKFFNVHRKQIVSLRGSKAVSEVLPASILVGLIEQ